MVTLRRQLNEEKPDALGHHTAESMLDAPATSVPMSHSTVSARINLRPLAVWATTVVIALSVWVSLSGAASLPDGDDCFLLSGPESGGVLVVLDCGALSNSETLVAASVPQTGAVSDPVQASAGTSSYLHVPVPRLWVGMMSRLFR